MVMDIQWTLTVQVPQLDVWGEQLVAAIQDIKDELTRLNEGQAQAADAIAAQLNAILAEMQQWQPGTPVPPEQMDNLLAALKTAADTAEQQAAAIRSNTDQITQIIPDTPPA